MGQIVGAGNAPFKVVRKDDGKDFIQTVNAYFGEVPIWLPKGTYTITEKCLPSGDEGLICGAGEKSIIQAATGLGSVLSFEQNKGSATARQLNVGLRDVCLDANGENICLEEWNCYHAQIERVLLKNFAQYGIYGDGQSTATTGHSYWNVHRDIRVSTAACTAAICLNKNYIDSFFYNIKGTANGVGFQVLGDGGHIVDDLWLVDVTNEIDLYATNDDIFNITFNRPRIDTPTDHGISMRLNNHSLTRCVINDPHFFNMGATKSNYKFVGFAAKAFLLVTTNGGTDDGAAPKYNFEYDNVGAMTTCRFYNHKLTTGTTAEQLNIPAGSIIQDA